MFTTTVSNQIATLTLSSPPVNSLSDAWVAGLSQQVERLEARSDWKVLHIRSDQKVFCAGGDLKEMGARFEAADCADRAYAYVASIQRVFARIEALPQVTLAEIGGAALGGGLELALSCDLRVAAIETKIGFTEVKLGLIPGAGGTQRLTRLVGRGLSSRLILGAEVIDGATAEKLGIVQWAVPRAEIQQRAADIAKRIAALPEAALRAAKLCVNSAADPGRGGYMDELETSRALQTNPETRALIGAFIAGVRTP